MKEKGVHVGVKNMFKSDIEAIKEHTMIVVKDDEEESEIEEAR